MAIINGTGKNDSLTGGTENDTINGLAGADTLNGGAGNDTLDGGYPTPDSLFGGTGDDRLYGTYNQWTDTIWIDDENYEIIEGHDYDTLAGGSGNDIYEFSSQGINIIELAIIEESGAGIDTVITPDPSHWLRPNVENLVFTRSWTETFYEGVTGYGNELDNRITSVSGNDTLDGRAGNDTLVAGNGHDELNGGLGNDSLVGGSGNDSLVGGVDTDGLRDGAGNDTMVGGTGDDEYRVFSTGNVLVEGTMAGIDTVKSYVPHTLGSNIENLILFGSAAINGTGNALPNRLTGNDGPNTLNGMGDTDYMEGRDGNDTYVVDNTGDTVMEFSASGGTDTVQSSVTYTLGANLENLVLTGAAAINGYGNALPNRLTGNGAANTLNGLGGADSMAGGLGNDIYDVDNTGDVVTEAPAAGTDTVRSSVTHTLAANAENLLLTGATAINGTGNAAANTLLGNTAANTLNGGAGNDLLLGGAGNDILAGASAAAPFGAAEIDTLTGGTGNDTFVLGVPGGRSYDDAITGTAGAGGYALITDFSAGDKLQLKGAAAGYYLGAAPVGLPTGQALFRNDSVAPAADELIAVIQGASAANALVGALVV